MSDILIVASYSEYWRRHAPTPVHSLLPSHSEYGCGASTMDRDDEFCHFFVVVHPRALGLDWSPFWFPPCVSVDFSLGPSWPLTSSFWAAVVEDVPYHHPRANPGPDYRYSVCSLCFPACASILLACFLLHRLSLLEILGHLLFSLCSRSRRSGHVCCSCLSSSDFLLTPFSPVSRLTLILFPTSVSFTLLASVFGPPSVCCVICDFFAWPRVCCGYPSRKPGIWMKRTSLMIIPRRLISPRKQTTHSDALFFFFFPFTA